jgi:hypothetical protein
MMYIIGSLHPEPMHSPTRFGVCYLFSGCSFTDNVLINVLKLLTVVNETHTNSYAYPRLYVIIDYLIIDIIETPLKGLFSDKNYKHINLLRYFYI